MTRSNRISVVSALACLLTFTATTPLRADADGIPHLDPTNGGAGTTYYFVMPAVSRTMDPATNSSQALWRGSFTLLQDAGAADFDIENMDIDLTGDGVADRTLSCSGWNGNTRFGMSCSEDDGGSDFRLLITGRVSRLANGALSLRKATGHGVTGTHTLLVTFGATSQ